MTQNTAAIAVGWILIFGHAQALGLKISSRNKIK
jgi:hypothetical protein